MLKLDDAISFEEAASFPLVFLTAWQMLVTKAKLKKGETVLIMGASSGVGSAAIQISKLQGAHVIATAGSAEKLSFAKDLGADEVIHHYDESISGQVKKFTDKKGVDVIFEHVGAKVWDECLRSLAWGGRLVTCGATSGPKISMDLRHLFIKQQQILGSTMGNKDDLIHVHEAMTQKKLRAVIAKSFHFTEVMEAHQYLESSQNLGKVVLNWA